MNPEISHSPEALLHNARQLLRSGDRAGAIAACTRARDLAPDDTGVAHLLAHLQIEAGQFDEAVAHLEQVLAANPARPVLRYQLGLARAGLGDLQAAESEYLSALAIKGDLLPARLNLGVARWRSGNEIGAVGAFLGALELAQRPDRRQDLPLESESVRTLMSFAVACVHQSRDVVIEGLLEPAETLHGKEACHRIRTMTEQLQGRTQPNWDHPRQRPAALFLPGLKAQPIWDNASLDFVERLEGAAQEIDELIQAAQIDDASWSALLRRANQAPAGEIGAELEQASRWAAVDLIPASSGSPALDARLAPVRARLESLGLPLTGIRDGAPDAMLIRLGNAMVLPSRTAGMNGRLTVHLPLQCDEAATWISVAGERHIHRRGSCVVFDAAFDLAEGNEGEQDSITLSLDIWHPELSQLERDLMKQVVEALNDFNARALAAA